MVEKFIVKGKSLLMFFEKNMPWRSKIYMDWVKTQMCCNCMAPADDPHHIAGFGGVMGTKNSDITVIPLCRMCHSRLHYGNIKIDQQFHALRTIIKATNEGIIDDK